MKLVLFNGPPGSGKGFAAAHCCEVFDGLEVEFKDKLFQIALEVSGFSHSRWFEIYNNRGVIGRNKETPLQELGGLSQRQLLIKISEEWIKPIFGNKYFGGAAARTVEECSSEIKNFFFSDSGFLEEARVLQEQFGYENVILVKLFREGHTFAGDSRNYLDAKDFHTTVEIDNDGTDAFKEQLEWMLGELVEV